ncbi:MAG: tetratricopeptide repeat protein [Pseudomonadota bacterium]|nr:tetratricopeptide repeat protein [Pseudomonadota bacterium]
MNHCISLTLATRLLQLAALALCSGCSILMSSAHHATSDLHFARGEYEAAIAEDTKGIEVAPDFYLGYVSRGETYTYARRYDLALEDYRKAMALKPEEAVSHLDYVKLLVFMRREQEAAEHAESFLRSHPDSALLKCGLAIALERSKAYPRAHELAGRCVAEFEAGANRRELPLTFDERSLAHFYGLHARLAARVGRKDEASRSIEKATSIRGTFGVQNDFETRYSRASVHYIEGNWEKALQVLDEAYAQAKGAEKDSMVGVESRFLLGQCYQQLGRWREAQGAYKEFIAANPHEKEAFANLGLVKAKLGDSESAVADFSKALDIDPKFLDARRNRGTEYLRQKRYESAIEDFSAVLAQDGSDAATLYRRAYAYCTNGQRTLGAKDLRAILRVEPKNDEAKALLSDCT